VTCPAACLQEAFATRTRPDRTAEVIELLDSPPRKKRRTERGQPDSEGGEEDEQQVWPDSLMACGCVADAASFRDIGFLIRCPDGWHKASLAVLLLQAGQCGRCPICLEDVEAVFMHNLGQSLPRSLLFLSLLQSVLAIHMLVTYFVEALLPNRIALDSFNRALDIFNRVCAESAWRDDRHQPWTLGVWGQAGGCPARCAQLPSCVRVYREIATSAAALPNPS
jgi:hypothetical protein